MYNIIEVFDVIVMKDIISLGCENLKISEIVVLIYSNNCNNSNTFNNFTEAKLLNQYCYCVNTFNL